MWLQISAERSVNTAARPEQEQGGQSWTRANPVHPQDESNGNKYSHLLLCPSFKLLLTCRIKETHNFEVLSFATLPVVKMQRGTVTGGLSRAEPSRAGLRSAAV